MSKIKRQFPVPSDLDIAQAAEVYPIKEIADQLGLEDEDLIQFGQYKAKVHLDVLKKLADRPSGKYIEEFNSLHSSAKPGSHVRYQRWGCGWRLQPGYTHGRLQPPPNWRHSRHYCCP